MGKITPMVALTIAWTLLYQFHTGYQTTSLNGVQSSLVCNGVPTPPVGGGPGPVHPHHGGGLDWMMVRLGMGDLDGCIAMTSSKFGLIVAVFTLGSLFGALSASPITSVLGRVGVLRLGATLSCLASLLFAVTNSTTVMIICRCIIGFGCGMSGVQVPLFLTELCPSLAQALGIANQLCFVSGLITAQALGLPFNDMMEWRWVMIVASGLAGSMAVFSLFASSPEELDDAAGEGEQTALLGNKEKKRDMSMKQLLKCKDTTISTGLRVIIVTQIVTQLSGISPVVYFSTSILRTVFHSQAGVISVLVLLIKLPASLLTIPLLPRWGSQATLTRCYMMMFVCLLVLALSLNASYPFVSFGAIICYFLMYGLGPGPVTWVVLSEVLPSEARTAASSLGQACAAVTGFMMSSTFLPLQQLFALLTPGKADGNVFFVFAVICLGIYFVVGKTFRTYRAAVDGVM